MQKVFWTQGAKVSEKSFAPPKTAFAPVQNGVWVVQKTFRRPLLPGSKRPFAPSPKHFWEFSLFGQFPRPVASQGVWVKHIDPEDAAPGESVCLIDAVWLDQWMKHVKEGGPSPGPISNHHLLDHSGDVRVQAGRPQGWKGSRDSWLALMTRRVPMQSPGPPKPVKMAPKVS